MWINEQAKLLTLESNKVFLSSSAYGAWLRKSRNEKQAERKKKAIPSETFFRLITDTGVCQWRSTDWVEKFQRNEIKGGERYGSDGEVARGAFKFTLVLSVLLSTKRDMTQVQSLLTWLKQKRKSAEPLVLACQWSWPSRFSFFLHLNFNLILLMNAQKSFPLLRHEQTHYTMPRALLNHNLGFQRWWKCSRAMQNISWLEAFGLRQRVA